MSGQFQRRAILDSFKLEPVSRLYQIVVDRIDTLSVSYWTECERVNKKLGHTDIRQPMRVGWEGRHTFTAMNDIGSFTFSFI